MPVMDGLSYAQSGQVILTSCLQMLTFWFSVSVPALYVRPDIFVGWFGEEVSQGLGFSWRAYMKRFSPAPSYHFGLCTLIFCDGTLETWMHRCVAHTKWMEILLLKYPHVLE